MKKRISDLTVSTLRVEEMFNVRGGNGDEKAKSNTAASKNTTAEGVDEDIIL